MFTASTRRLFSWLYFASDRVLTCRQVALCKEKFIVQYIQKDEYEGKMIRSRQKVMNNISAYCVVKHVTHLKMQHSTPHPPLDNFKLER